MRYGYTEAEKNEVLTERIFHNVEGIVPIDEIETLPPDAHVRRRSRMNGGASGLPTLPGGATLPDSSVERQGKISQQGDRGQLAAAQLLTSSGQMLRPQGFSIWYCFDSLRWWLLYPGRLEFLLWSIGIIILFSATVFFLLAMISLGLFGSGGHIG